MHDSESSICNTICKLLKNFKARPIENQHQGGAIQRIRSVHRCRRMNFRYILTGQDHLRWSLHKLNLDEGMRIVAATIVLSSTYL